MKARSAGIEGVIIDLDGIAVNGQDDATHLERIQKVLQILTTAGFRFKRNKHEFFTEKNVELKMSSWDIS